MSKKLVSVFIFILLIFCLFSYVNADTGPKPSVRISFENLGDELCYGTLLSKSNSTGPSSAWDGTEEDARHNGNEYYDWSELDYETWKAFVEYEDSDGFYFLQEGWRIDETKELAWTYYPPSEFKILLYFPESGSYVASDIYERYAFDSYFTVDLKELSDSDKINVHKSYNHFDEIMSLIARIVITIVIELGIALLFGYGIKKQMLFITVVNVITQIVLNVLLNITNYKSGQYAFIACYVMLEFVIVLIEAVLYKTFLKKLCEDTDRKRMPILYAIVANIVSFAAGMFIAVAFPGIF